MNRLRIQLRLICSAWPFFIAVILIAAHIASIDYAPCQATKINKLVSLVLQLVGGFFVIWSIDSNLGIITGIRLKEAFFAYVAKIKQAGKAVVISIQGLSASSSIGSATLTTKRIPITIEDKIADLQIQVDEIKFQIQKETAGLNQKISDVQNTLEAQIRAAQSTIETLQRNVREVTVGGIKLQLFGAYLLVHGAIAGYFT